MNRLRRSVSGSAACLVWALAPVGVPRPAVAEGLLAPRKAAEGDTTRHTVESIDRSYIGDLGLPASEPAWELALAATWWQRVAPAPPGRGQAGSLLVESYSTRTSGKVTASEAAVAIDYEAENDRLVFEAELPLLESSQALRWFVQRHDSVIALGDVLPRVLRNVEPMAAGAAGSFDTEALAQVRLPAEVAGAEPSAGTWRVVHWDAWSAVVEYDLRCPMRAAALGPTHGAPWLLGGVMSVRGAVWVQRTSRQPWSASVASTMTSGVVRTAVGLRSVRESIDHEATVIPTLRDDGPAISDDDVTLFDDKDQPVGRGLRVAPGIVMTARALIDVTDRVWWKGADGVVWTAEHVALPAEAPTLLFVAAAPPAGERGLRWPASFNAGDAGTTVWGTTAAAEFRATAQATGIVLGTTEAPEGAHLSFVPFALAPPPLGTVLRDASGRLLGLVAAADDQGQWAVASRPPQPTAAPLSCTWTAWRALGQRKGVADESRATLAPTTAALEGMGHAWTQAALRMRGRSSETTAHLVAWAQTNRERPDVLLALAEAYREGGRVDAWATTLQQLAKGQPPAAAVQRGLAVATARYGDPPLVEEIAEALAKWGTLRWAPDWMRARARAIAEPNRLQASPPGTDRDLADEWAIATGRLDPDVAAPSTILFLDAEAFAAAAYHASTAGDTSRAKRCVSLGLRLHPYDSTLVEYANRLHADDSERITLFAALREALAPR